MLVFKFGGASVKDANSVRNLAEILKKYNDKLLIVISAMGKTTNALEKVVNNYYSGNRETSDALQKVKDYHQEIIEDLFPEKQHSVFSKVEEIYTFLDNKINSAPSLSFDFEYDQIVSAGEFLSTLIVAEYLNTNGVKVVWKDIRKSLISDNIYREANINWELSGEKVKEEFCFKECNKYITQGFLASTMENYTTTLGREGSDYTAAILAYILEAEKVIIWKDVPGILNADPKYFPEAVLLKEISFRDAIELTYYGAKVIHPKTIQPLQRKNINLYVKSFLHPEAEGTKVGNVSYDKLVPSFIFKNNQALIHIYPKDFSFIAEENLHVIFGSFARNRLDINMMQNSAVSFQVCVNNDRLKIERILKELSAYFTVEIENGLELATIRYYDESTIEKITAGKDKILEQRNKTTVQVVMK